MIEPLLAENAFKFSTFNYPTILYSRKSPEYPSISDTNYWLKNLMQNHFVHILKASIKPYLIKPSSYLHIYYNNLMSKLNDW